MVNQLLLPTVAGSTMFILLAVCERSMHCIEFA